MRQTDARSNAKQRNGRQLCIQEKSISDAPVILMAWFTKKFRIGTGVFYGSADRRKNTLKKGSCKRNSAEEIQNNTEIIHELYRNTFYTQLLLQKSVRSTRNVFFQKCNLQFAFGKYKMVAFRRRNNYYLLEQNDRLED